MDFGRDESRPYADIGGGMPFDPDIHHRRSIRLQHYDYSTAGAYFVTICTFQRECLFGEVVEGNVKLNRFGDTVANYWRAMVTYFPAVELDIFEVMPNHVHGIIVLNDSISPVGARFIAPKRSDLGDDNQGAMNQGAMNRAPTVGEIVRAVAPIRSTNCATIPACRFGSATIMNG